MGGEAFLFPIIEQEALFVRKCYHDLYEIIKKAPIAHSIRIMLTGTPGIGKSTFLVYFIIRYLYDSTIAPDSSKNPTATFQNDERLVISSGQTRDVLIFQPAESGDLFYAFAGRDIVRKGTYTDFEAFFLLQTTWYLVDWKPKSKPKSKAATSLFALSPNSIRDDDFKDFEKVLDMRLCMPVWTYNELEKCREYVFPQLSNKTLNYIYDRVGGVPRSCLEAPAKALRFGESEEEACKRGLLRLEDALNNIKNPLTVLRAQEETLGGIKVSDRLLHKMPDSETSYRDGSHRVWASAYVIDKFVNIVDAQSASDMSRAVWSGLKSNGADGTLGKVFECYVRHLFFKGGGVKLRKRRLYKALDNGEHELSHFTIPEGLEHKPFSAIADFSIPKKDTGTIWTPGPCFPSVDIILTPNLLFQITISLHHPVKQEPLWKILKKLPVKKKILLYFVVPEGNFETFTFQNYHNELGKVSQTVPKSVEKIEQWVLEVPLEGLYKEQIKVQGMKRVANEEDMQQLQPPKKRAANNMQQPWTPNRRKTNWTQGKHISLKCQERGD